MTISAALVQIGEIIATVPNVVAYVERPPVSISPAGITVAFQSDAFTSSIVDGGSRVRLNCSSTWTIRIPDDNSQPVTDLLNTIESIIQTLELSLHPSITGPLCALTIESAATSAREPGSNYVDGILGVDFSIYLQRTDT